MSAVDEAAAAAVTQLARSGDGTFLGLAAAYFAVRCIVKFTATSAAIGKIRDAPSAHVADLRSIASLSDGSDREEFVVLRGLVESKSNFEGFCDILFPKILVSQKSNVEGVISQSTQTCLYNEWKGFSRWTSHVGCLFARFSTPPGSKSTSMVPFVLAGGPILKTDYVIVNMDGSKHPLPLVTVFHELVPIRASPFTLLLALFGQEYPVGLLNQEKILPLGKEITAVGYVSLKDEIAEIRSCKDFPYFLSDMSKSEMLEELNLKAKVLLWSGIVFGSLAIGLLGYAAVRNLPRWARWNEWRQYWRAEEQNCDEAIEEQGELDDGDVGEAVPDGLLCAVCLSRRKKYAFAPCGHLVCCRRCAVSITMSLSPKCPLCRQDVRSSLRIFSDS